MAAWATISEVLSYTRIAVESEDLDSAQVMIEIFADVVYGQTEHISTKNLRLLKMAVAYQAAWMTQHPDLFTHTDIQSINQDGIFYVHQHENSYLLAPMARRCIKRLSWNRVRNIKVRPSNNRLGGRKFIQDTSEYELIDSYPNNTPEQDDSLDWEGM
jgi:hypothetical protein